MEGPCQANDVLNRMEGLCRWDQNQTGAHGRKKHASVLQTTCRATFRLPCYASREVPWGAHDRNFPPVVLSSSRRKELPPRPCTALGISSPWSNLSMSNPWTDGPAQYPSRTRPPFETVVPPPPPEESEPVCMDTLQKIRTKVYEKAINLKDTFRRFDQDKDQGPKDVYPPPSTSQTQRPTRPHTSRLMNCILGDPHSFPRSYLQTSGLLLVDVPFPQPKVARGSSQCSSVQVLV